MKYITLFIITISLYGCISYNRDYGNYDYLLNDFKYQENRVALVIGNSNYQFIDRLDNPVNDSREIKEKLEKLGFKVIYLENGDKNTMDRYIHLFKTEINKKGDLNKNVSLFYYAGHGLSIDGRNLLIPIDMNLTKDDASFLSEKSIKLDKIQRVMETSESDYNIAILDACRNDPKIDLLINKYAQRSLKASREFYVKRKPPTNPLDIPEGKKNIFLAFATAPYKTAGDGVKTDKNGVFTKFLLKNMLSRHTEIHDVFRNTIKDVEKYTNKNGDSLSQVPQIITSAVSDFYFFQLDTEENILWNEITKINKPGAYKFYLNEFPNGNYIAEAKKHVELYEKEIEYYNAMKQLSGQTTYPSF